MKQQPTSNAVLRAVAADRYAIGYSGIGLLSDAVRAVPLARAEADRERGEIFAPEAENAYSGDYPLSRFLLLYVNYDRDGELDPLRREFLSYVLSRQGQLDVVEAGLPATHVPGGCVPARQVQVTDGDSMMQFRTLSLSLALSGLAALATLAGCAGGPAERPAGALFADAAPEVTVEQPSFARPGYSAFVRGDRLWVFEANSPACEEFVANGPSLARAVRINDGGPDGMTICADSGATIDAYLCSRVGFRVEVVDDRVWVFRADSPEHAAFLADGPPRQHAVAH